MHLQCLMKSLNSGARPMEQIKITTRRIFEVSTEEPASAKGSIPV